MSAIYKEGHWYPADSLNTLKAVTMSNADYEALTPQEKEELGGIEIFIPDRPLTSGGTGAVIIYNGVEYAGTPTSRLENLEEIVGDGQQSVGSDLTDAVTQLNSSLNIKTTLIRDLLTGTSKTISANQTTNVDIDANKTGFEPLAFAGFDIKDGNLNIINIGFIGGNIVRIWVKNISSSSITIIPTVTVLYQRIS